MSFTLVRGRVPLLISFPHSGTHVPPDLLERFTPAARCVPDTDWHVPTLYAFARQIGAWTLEAHLSRYVIDLNRDPQGESLYPGQSTTTLCPVDTFDDEPIYHDSPPAAAEIKQRIEHYWQPYHDTLRRTIETMRSEYDRAIVWDAHSIRSVVPRFFDGTLKPLNLGTARGTSCAPALRDAVVEVLNAGHLPLAVDERFIGGFITRHYGAPQDGVHTLQMEIAQSAYMDETGEMALRAQPTRALSALLQRAVQTAAKFNEGI